MSPDSTIQLATQVKASDLADAVFRAALQLLAVECHPAEHDWFTDNHGGTYVDTPAGQVSADPRVAVLIDAYHVLHGCSVSDFRFTDAQIREYLGTVFGMS